MKWSPNLCSCQVSVVVTDRGGMAQFRHEGTIKSCPEHQNKTGQELVDALVLENRKYSAAVAVLENRNPGIIEKLLGKPETQIDDSTQAEVGIDESRNVIITLPVTILKEDEDAIRAALSSDVIVTTRIVVSPEEEIVPTPIR